MTKLFPLLITGALLTSCATPGIHRKFDEFAGGDVIELKENQLDSPGIGDIYFNAKAFKKKDGTTANIEVTGVVDYEYQSIDPLFVIDKTKDLALIVDGKNLYLKPVADTYNHLRTAGALQPLHIESLKYAVTIDDLKMIAAAKVVKMKVYLKNHREGGISGTFTPENSKQLNSFLASIQ
jgi:hypothetical protein